MGKDKRITVISRAVPGTKLVTRSEAAELLAVPVGALDSALNGRRPVGRDAGDVGGEAVYWLHDIQTDLRRTSRATD